VAGVTAAALFACLAGGGGGGDQIQVLLNGRVDPGVDILGLGGEQRELSGK